jgi:hypothetical protein
LYLQQHLPQEPQTSQFCNCAEKCSIRGG